MRKLMWFTLGFGAACALGTYVRIGIWAFWLAAALCAGAVIPAMVLKNKNGRRAAAWLLGVGIGIAWFLAYDLRYTAPIRALDGETVHVKLTTYTAGWETDYGSAADCYLDLEGNRYQVRLYLDEVQEIEPWTAIECPVTLRLTTDGGAEEPTFHRSQGILALCYQQDSAVFSAEESSPTGIVTVFVANLRRRLLSVIDTAFPADTRGIAKALFLGDRTGLSYETGTDFKISGISHIVAVSGLHVSIVFALVYTLTFRRRWLLALFGIPVTVLFMALTAFTPSVTRAGIMQIMTILALCADREYDPPSALSFAALVMLIANPLVISSVGFQLSVGSVAGIFLFYGPVSQWLSLRIPDGKGKITKALRGWFLSGISVTLSAQVITTPLVAVSYGTVSLIGVAANLAVLWVVTFIFYGVMLVCLLGLLSVRLAAGVGLLVSWPIRYVLWTARVLSRMPMAAVYTESVYIVIWLILCYCLLGLLIFGKGKRPLFSAAMAVLCLIAALALSWIEPLLFDQCVTALDVGQGQCVILQHRGKTFVVDCGGDRAEDAADRCAEKLLSMGISRIDGLILTHCDHDHAGGAAFVLHRIDADAVYLPAAGKEWGEQAVPAAWDGEMIRVTQDLRLSSEGLNITLFAQENSASANESGIAVLFQTEKCDTLIIGDMNAAQERKLIRRTRLPRLEVLIVGHHGSKNSTSLELLAATTPETAIICVGEDNAYGHPAQQTLDRLSKAGCAVYRTDQSGDITYRR